MACRKTALLVALLGGATMSSIGDGNAAPVEKEKSFPTMQGLTVEAAYIGDIVLSLNPGIVAGDRKTVYQGELDFGINVDTAKVGWWNGGKFHVHAVNFHGGQPSARHIGDLQVASNIEAEPHTLLYEAWYEQQFDSGHASLLAGLHDLNSEFYLSDDAAIFLNSSFGIGAEITANVPTSTFPRLGLGIRLRLQPVVGLDAAIASYDGDPATRKLSKAEGRMDIAELGFSYRRRQTFSGTIKFGAWHHTATHMAPFSAQSFAGDYGFYGLIDQQVASWKGGYMAAFIDYGAVPADRNTVSSCLTGGIHLVGLGSGRPDDQLGIGMARASNLYAPGSRGFETTWELTYQLAIGKYLNLQPSFQWIRHPQGNPANPDVRVLLGRLILEL